MSSAPKYSSLEAALADAETRDYGGLKFLALCAVLLACHFMIVASVVPVFDSIFSQLYWEKIPIATRIVLSPNRLPHPLWFWIGTHAGLFAAAGFAARRGWDANAKHVLWMVILTAGILSFYVIALFSPITVRP